MQDMPWTVGVSGKQISSSLQMWWIIEIRPREVFSIMDKQKVLEISEWVIESLR